MKSITLAPPIVIILLFMINCEIFSVANSQPPINKSANLTGSVQILPLINEAIMSKIHTNLSSATSMAEQAINVNTSALAVALTIKNGFLVYDALFIGTENDTFYDVIIDAGNGKVLSVEQFSNKTSLSNGTSDVMRMPWPICRVFGECPRPF